MSDVMGNYAIPSHDRVLGDLVQIWLLDCRILPSKGCDSSRVYLSMQIFAEPPIDSKVDWARVSAYSEVVQSSIA
jgi:hypothetical protein